MWCFDRSDRLDDLVARCREQETYLRRARCDAAPESFAILDRRLGTVARRFRLLSTEARRARRLEVAR